MNSRVADQPPVHQRHRPAVACHARFSKAKREGMEAVVTIEPKNVSTVETVALRSNATPDAEWVGGFFAYGGWGAEKSVVISFAVPPAKRLGRHTDTAEETQFILSGR